LNYKLVYKNQFLNHKLQILFLNRISYGDKINYIRYRPNMSKSIQTSFESILISNQTYTQLI